MNHRNVQLKTSSKELIDLTKSLLAIGLAFTIVMNGLKFDISFLISFIISILTVGIGFVLHELAHKIVAQKYHCWAEFRSQDSMLVLAILLSITGFIFAAPGAVMIMGRINKEQNGKISAAGPATNLILAILFLMIAVGNLGILRIIGMYGFTINSWLALFNLIPFGNFDGIKILNWNKMVYGAMAGIALLLVFGSNYF